MTTCSSTLDCPASRHPDQHGEGAARPTADSRGSRPCDSITGTAHLLPTTEGKTSAFCPAPDRRLCARPGRWAYPVAWSRSSGYGRGRRLLMTGTSELLVAATLPHLARRSATRHAWGGRPGVQVTLICRADE